VIQLARTTFAALRDCGERYGADEVLEQLRHRRAGYPELGEMESLDRLIEGYESSDSNEGFRCIDTKTAQALADPETLVEPPQWTALLLDDRKQRVQRAVRQLPLPEKRVVRMRYWEELSFRVIALYLGFSTDRAEHLHCAALARLRNMLIIEANRGVDGKTKTT